MQLCSNLCPWDKDCPAAADKFFKDAIDNSGTDAYTGRVK